MDHNRGEEVDAPFARIDRVGGGPAGLNSLGWSDKWISASSIKLPREAALEHVVGDATLAEDASRIRVNPGIMAGCAVNRSTSPVPTANPASPTPSGPQPSTS